MFGQFILLLHIIRNSNMEHPRTSSETEKERKTLVKIFCIGKVCPCSCKLFHLPCKSTPPMDTTRDSSHSPGTGTNLWLMLRIPNVELLVFPSQRRINKSLFKRSMTPESTSWHKVYLYEA